MQPFRAGAAVGKGGRRANGPGKLGKGKKETGEHRSGRAEMLDCSGYWKGCRILLERSVGRDDVRKSLHRSKRLV